MMTAILIGISISVAAIAVGITYLCLCIHTFCSRPTPPPADMPPMALRMNQLVAMQQRAQWKQLLQALDWLALAVTGEQPTDPTEWGEAEQALNEEAVTIARMIDELGGAP